MAKKAKRKPKPKPKGFNYSRISGVDPYIDWAFSLGKAYFPTDKEGNTQIPVLLQLNRISVAKFAREKRFIRGAGKRTIRISSLYRRPPRGLEATKNCTALVTRQFFDVLKDNDDLAGFVARVTLGPSLIAEGLSRPASQRPSAKDRPWSR